MEDISYTAKGPSAVDDTAKVDTSSSSQTNANDNITSTASDGASAGMLGTPQERLEIIQQEVRVGTEAGLQIRFDERQGYLVILVSGVQICPSCGWWNLDASCANETCLRNSKKVGVMQ